MTITLVLYNLKLNFVIFTNVYAAHRLYSYGLYCKLSRRIRQTPCSLEHDFFFIKFLSVKKA